MFFDAEANTLAMLPERLQSILEFQVIAGTADPELDGLNGAIGLLAASASVSTASGDGLLRWEKILGVSASINSTDEARRQALRARLMAKPPINLTTLRGIVEAFMGVPVEISVADSVVSVVYRGTSRVADLTPLYAELYETIPASLIVTIAYKYVVWAELDAQELTFDELDALGLDWDTFERGEWIG